MIQLPHDNHEIAELAQATVNHPAAIEIARIAARDIGVPPGMSFHKLRFYLAHAYASGFVRGRKGQHPDPERPITPDPLGQPQ